MDEIILPTNYDKLNSKMRKRVREMYVELQNGICAYCGTSLNEDPPKEITGKRIFWDYFPPNFLQNPIHLQHDHNTGMTEGAVHAYCNAVLWQYHNK